MGGPRNQRPPLLPGAGAVRFEGATTSAELFHAPPLPTEAPGAESRRKARELREKGVVKTSAKHGHFVTTNAAFQMPSAIAVLTQAGKPPAPTPVQRQQSSGARRSNAPSGVLDTTAASEDYRPPGTAARARGAAPGALSSSLADDAAEALLPWRAKNYKPVEHFCKTSKFTAHTTAHDLMPGHAPSLRPTRHGAAQKHSPRRSVLRNDESDDDYEEPQSSSPSQAAAVSHAQQHPARIHSALHGHPRPHQAPPRPATVASGAVSPLRSIFDPNSPSRGASRDERRARYVSTSHLLEQMAMAAVSDAGGCGHTRPPKVPPRPQFKGLGDTGGRRPTGWADDRPASSSYTTIFGGTAPTPEPVARRLRKTRAPPPVHVAEDRDFVTASQQMALEARTNAAATPTAGGRLGYSSALRAGSAAVASRSQRLLLANAGTPVVDDATQTL